MYVVNFVDLEKQLRFFSVIEVILCLDGQLGLVSKDENLALL